MSERTPYSFLHRILALAVSGVALGFVVWVMALPLADASATRDAAQQRLARFEALLQDSTANSIRYDPRELSAVHLDDADAQIALQTALDRLARESSLITQAVRPFTPDTMGGVGRAVWVDMTATGDLQGLTDFLVALDAERPTLLVRRLEVERGDGVRPDTAMRIRLEAGRAWRPEAPKP